MINLYAPPKRRLQGSLTCSPPPASRSPASPASASSRRSHLGRHKCLKTFYHWNRCQDYELIAKLSAWNFAWVNGISCFSRVTPATQPRSTQRADCRASIAPRYNENCSALWNVTSNATQSLPENVQSGRPMPSCMRKWLCFLGFLMSFHFKARTSYFFINKNYDILKESRTKLLKWEDDIKKHSGLRP